MVDVELDESDYKTILAWYELAFAGKDVKAHKTKDLDTLNKIGVMCKAYLKELKDEAES
jgi:hypothetical protein